MSYYSDREIGPRPQIHETVELPLWGGLVARIKTGIGDGSFGVAFPEPCSDLPSIPVGTDSTAMGLAVLAEIPALAEATPDSASPRDFSGWPLRPDALPPTPAILDLIEFCHRNIAEPVKGYYHSFFRHHHVTSWNRAAGQTKWREDANRLIERSGVAYELMPNGHIVRTGTPIATDTVRAAVFDTGDPELDDLLARARSKYLDTDTAVRRESLEQLWDAFERTKTLRDPDKKRGVEALISEAAESEAMRSELNDEALRLTKIGNDFRIRHHETSKQSIADSDVDYLFHRGFAFLANLLGLHPRE